MEYGRAGRGALAALSLAVGLSLSGIPASASGPVVGWGAGPPPSVNGTAGTASAIAASFFTCAIQAGSGAVVCWYPGTSPQPPDAVNGTAGTATAVTAGLQHACAIQAGLGLRRL
jgi:hypothetical protein